MPTRSTAVRWPPAWPHSLSFSLFGMHAGVPADDLHLRIKTAQQGYAAVSEKIEAELSQAVAEALYSKIKHTFPPAYNDALNDLWQFDVQVDAARRHADRGRSATREAHGTSVDATFGRPAKGPCRHGILDRGGRAIVLQVEKLASERILTLTKPLTNAVPILEPSCKPFAEAVDKTLQDRIGRSYDRLLATAMQNAPELNAAIEREARTIVDQTDVKPVVERATPRAQRLVEQLTATQFFIW